MRRPFARSLVLPFVLALTAGACSADDPDPTIPTVPTQINIIETFTGTMTRNGAVSFPFTALSQGTATATLTTVGPDATIPVGISVGAWNGTSCTAAISNDNALQGYTLTASINSAGSLCLRIYDASARIVDPITFTVEIIHP
jgi:hypothetical protein